MRRIARWVGYGLGIIIVLALIASGWIWFASARVLNRHYVALPENLPRLAGAQVAEGPRLIRILGCVDCHGEGLRGRSMFDEPNTARVWAPNISLIARQASDQQLAQAIRQGIGRDGRGLIIMPSGQFSRLSEVEVAALVAAIRQLPPGGQAQPSVAVGPLGRLGTALGKFKPAPATLAEFSARQPYFVDREHEAGRVLAGKVCSDCHGPDLSGGMPGFDREPPDLRIVGGYTAEEFRRLLRTGRASGNREVGMMSDVARKSLSSLRDDEIDSIHAYLKARAERLNR